MTTSVSNTSVSRRQNVLPSLENGDHMDQPTFHARYMAMPKSFRAELIGGVVHVSSPLKTPHGDIHGKVMMWLNLYHAMTPGTRAFDNATDILGPDSEPQPDGCLIIEGGQTRIDESEYLVGPPELVAEVASSSEAYDLFEKRDDYERHGVGEYLVLLVRETRAVWFTRSPGIGGFVELHPGNDGVHRSIRFPGLWLDAGALFRGDAKRVIDVTNAGLASAEHAAFTPRAGNS